MTWQIVRVPHLVMGWQIAAWSALGLAVAAGLVAVLRPQGHRGRLAVAVVRESAVVVGLYAAWQLVGTLARVNPDGALRRGQDLVAIEHWLHLPDERSLQAIVLPHTWLVQLANGYYAYGHFTGLIVFLAWMFLRHRDRYPDARTSLVLSTGLCFCCQLVAVAPPRLLPGGGYVDTAEVYGESVYGSATFGIADQLSAFPSVHVGWAALIGWYVWRVGGSRWRWLGPVHFVVTTLVVVVTANHYWLDGIAAIALLALALASQAAARSLVAGTDESLAWPDDRTAP
ncbi:MAG: phosphatase PAP2 family protein [Nocardioidaceae bacterium]